MVKYKNLKFIFHDLLFFKFSDLKNFQKLPDNIKEQLLDICNKSITANT